MTNTLEGYAYRFTGPDLKARGGKAHRYLLVLAATRQQADLIADRLKPGAIFERSGPGILGIAQKIGVDINSAKVVHHLT
jgi:hypothetical protein